MDVHGGGHNF